MDRAASMWQLLLSSQGKRGPVWDIVTRIVSASLFACWPRTLVRTAEEARIELKVPLLPEYRTVRDERWYATSDDQYVMGLIRQLNSPNQRWPFEITVVPLYKGDAPGLIGDRDCAELAVQMPPDEVTWYIYCSLTHAYSDGASGQALFTDLLIFYDEERCKVGLPPVLSHTVPPPEKSHEVPEQLSLLQRRLRASLRGRLPGAQGDPNNDVYHEVLCEDWGKRIGISRRVFFTDCVLQALRYSAVTKLGCSIDVAWLTAITGCLFRLFPKLTCIRLMLKVACRDGPGEREMVGFLSEQRILPVDLVNTEASTLVDVARRIDTGRRLRAWRAPQPFESGLCVYVNVVSAMGDGLPSGFQHITKAIGNQAQRANCPAYCHLNVRIDQLKADEWDFRIFHFDSSWGADWSDHFALALGMSIHDMAVAPTAPLLGPRGTPPNWVQKRDYWKRGANGDSEWNAETPAAKVARV
jgi:hypothetical protein